MRSTDLQILYSRKMWKRGARYLGRKIESGEITSLELTRYFIDRIERLDGQINSVVVRAFDRALRKAYVFSIDLDPNYDTHFLKYNARTTGKKRIVPKRDSRAYTEFRLP